MFARLLREAPRTCRPPPGLATAEADAVLLELVLGLADLQRALEEKAQEALRLKTKVLVAFPVVARADSAETQHRPQLGSYSLLVAQLSGRAAAGGSQPSIE